MSVHLSALRTANVAVSETFLRLPPFPGRRIHGLAPAGASSPSDIDVPAIAELLRSSRVGGSFWGRQPSLPARYLIVRTIAALDLGQPLAGDAAVVFWTGMSPAVVERARIVVTGECDPWHMLAGAEALVTDAEDETAIVAALLGVPTYRVVDGKLERMTVSLEDSLATVLPAAGYADPFSGETLDLESAIRLCTFWRNLIDRNRDLVGGLGFAFWKQDNVAALLWNGAEPFRFFKSAADIPAGSVAIWRSKASDDSLRTLEARGADFIEVEDGFLRSQGLGADCVPPLSITVDRRGAYFDPARPSDLEDLLENGQFSNDLLARAKQLRHTIVQAGLSKYDCAASNFERRCEQRLHILVPGQVEDDRSVQAGGCGLSSNLELLRRVRERAPDAYILYKPHPDVTAGHRLGDVPEEACVQFADEVVQDAAIASLIAMVDEVHVNTSLAGFEALLRKKPVVTYGVPFYAGWGLTQDLGPVPKRRTAQRSLDELVAASLLLYPIYLDPLTGLPCPAEVVVRRLTAGDVPNPKLVVAARRLQGKLVRRVRSLVQ